MEIVATIEARIGLNRLPGKVLKRLDGVSIRDISYGKTIYGFSDEKSVCISELKRRFGWGTVPIFTGEKLYIREFFKTVSNAASTNIQAWCVKR
tara:strand:- start:1545 stop:1826 length:282 start_codon:yes stop_codon:yes gene_type:complete